MIRHDYHTRANGRPHPYESVRWLGWGLLTCAGLLLGLILFVSLAGCATVQPDTWCDGLPPIYGTDC
ncbi:hypothetical protein UFOVP920_7 [uncultured Caudovirales phage]|uniref:Uncharacterized protein n=1 Tax=uncultured Caudovirales phage TaxID=2100421 RepID=A0A6J5PID3_9CAUD|nr:hypothetical protein UFOVP920_7 [uncultured Caudovirales phage]CAB4199736.1 hypothetical protein UFOVP1345_7 [uncultured Caudovirales phage]CAB5228610.1 hypothetical protein UFOVP1542_7 [uncultured Caudovirales phage]